MSCCSFSISVDKLCELLFLSGARHIDYARNIDDKLENLKRDVDNLKTKKNDVADKVKREESKGYKRIDQVSLWLDEVDKIISDFQTLSEHISNLRDCCCSIKSHYKAGKSLAKLATIVEGLKDQTFDQIANQPLPVILRNSQSPIGVAYALDEVCNHLRDEHVGVIGLYGEGGIGKTTILTELNNKLYRCTDSNLEFDPVIWVSVSKTIDLQKVLNDIGRRISHKDEDWKGKSKDDIFQVLNGKKFLLLLDDVWDKIDLGTIGIPFQSPENQSKIVFTSRSLQVCGQMGAQKMIKVKTLSREDAWHLFSDKVGESTLNVDLGIKKVAQEICEKCEGLPLMINTLGLAMSSKKTLHDWDFMLKRITIKGLEDEKILATLALSYDSLRNETIKSCFLYLCFFASTNGIRQDQKNDLVLQWFAEGLLDDFENYSVALSWGCTILNELQSAGLCDVVPHDTDFFFVSYRMHDRIIEMGQWVVKKGCGKSHEKFLTHANRMQSDKIYMDAKRMFLCGSDIEVLNTPPHCPNLSTLVLHCNCNLKTISDDFFNYMPNLRVLSLSGCKELRTLPEGICALKNLRYLNIQNTHIIKLPMTIQELTDMQILILEVVDEVPSGIISSFKDLLHFDYTGWPQSPGHKLLVELASLKLLKSLKLEQLLYLSESNNLLINSKILRNRTFKLGFQGYKSMIEDIDISLFSGMKRLEFFRVAYFQKLLRVSSEKSFAFRSLIWVDINNCRALEDISDLLITLTNLKHLRLSDCTSMKALLKKEDIDRRLDANLKPFGRLQKVSLYYMDSLEYICPNNQQFPYLSSFEMWFCPRLHKLPFTPTNAGRLSCIKVKGISLDSLQYEDEESRAFIHDKIRAL